MDRRTLLTGTFAMTGGILVPSLRNLFPNSDERTLTTRRDDLRRWDTETPNKVSPLAALTVAREKVMYARNPYPLYALAGEIAQLVGYQAFDRGEVAQADNAFALAAKCAHRMGGADGVSLASRVNVSKTRMLVHCAQAGVTGATGTQWRQEALRTSMYDNTSLTSYERALVHRAQARAQSNVGDARATMDAVTMAERLYERAVDHPEDVPSCVWQDGVYEHMGDIYQSVADLVLLGDASLARVAVDGLVTAANGPTRHVRTGAFSLITAASVCIQHGDREEGLELAAKGLRLVDDHGLQSAQADYMLGQLRRRALDASVGVLNHGMWVVVDWIDRHMASTYPRVIVQ